MNSPLPHSLKLSILRGGTSRALFLRLRDLPHSQPRRDELCLRLIGSPDPIASDGLGGGVSSNSKVMFVGTPTEAHEAFPDLVLQQETDVVSYFAQVSPTENTVDWGGNCGNISSAISAYALAEGLITFPHSSTSASCRVYNINTHSYLELHHPVEQGAFPRHGDFQLDGVPGTAPRVDLRFLAPRQEVIHTAIDGLTTTLINVTNPIAIFRAHDVGMDIDASPHQLNSDKSLLSTLENLRRTAGKLMGLEPSAVIPRVAIVEPYSSPSYPEGCLKARMTSLGVVHHAIPGTGLLALAAARALGSPVIDLPPAEHTTVLHPKGKAKVSANVQDGVVSWVALARSARLIMSGTVYLSC
ncbi:hypothetical protein GSS88_04795 [Corynebacterium sp. 3HC-13]|uniref:PrpF domain-containing protein n=1 Tax=Corynebacterium poyangense TaxID=2684405 RepID=UPI001CC9D375|nr:PrpF domain-containing protein [Corynebacterium poyangense]MBZ8177118.1 hypothetical protein [Corynebacterium poyangense]